MGVTSLFLMLSMKVKIGLFPKMLKSYSGSYNVWLLVHTYVNVCIKLIFTFKRQQFLAYQHQLSICFEYSVLVPLKWTFCVTCMREGGDWPFYCFSKELMNKIWWMLPLFLLKMYVLENACGILAYATLTVIWCIPPCMNSLNIYSRLELAIQWYF